MFCGKCGSEFNDDTLFCPNCGEPVSQQPEVEEILAEASLEEEAAAPQEFVAGEDTAVADEVVADGSEEDVITLNTEGAEAAPKKISKLPFLIGGIAVVVVAALLAVFNWANISGFFTRTFSSPEKLHAKVYEEVVADAFDEADAVIADAKNAFANSGSEGVIRIELDKAVLDLIAGQGMDMSWLSDIAIAYDVSMKDSRCKISYDALLGDTKLISADQYMDMESLEHWIRIPELNDNAMYMNLSESSGISKEELTKVLDAIPSEEVLSRVATRYVGILMSGFGDVEKSAETVKIDGVSQRLYLLEATMDEDDLVDILEDIIKELKKDDDVEDIIRNMEKVSGEEGLYDSLLESLDDAMSELDAENMDIPSFKIKLTTYLNGANEIVGIAAKYSASGISVEPFSYVTVEQGKKFATEIQFGAGDEVLLIEGNGTTGKTTTGEYVVTYQNEEVLTVKVQDYAVDEKQTTGTIRIIPNKTFIKNFLTEQFYLDDSAVDVAAGIEWALQIKLSGKPEDMVMSVSVAGNETNYVTLSVSEKETAASEITLPEKYINMDDYDFEEQWAETVNQEFLNTLFERLVEAGVPEELLEMALMGAM